MVKVRKGDTIYFNKKARERYSIVHKEYKIIATGYGHALVRITVHDGDNTRERTKYINYKDCIKLKNIHELHKETLEKIRGSQQ